MRWARRAFSDMVYKKKDRFRNADGERHTREDFENTYRYLSMPYTIFEDKLACNDYADRPKFYIAVRSGINHITIALTTMDPKDLVPIIAEELEGVRLKYLGNGELAGNKVRFYQTNAMFQYPIVRILRRAGIPCQQHRPYIMHMTIKDDDMPRDIVITRNNIYSKAIHA